MKSPAICEGYRDDTELRDAYFAFIRTVFPRIDFEEWYRRGFWRDAYVPVSAVVDGKIVSNVSLARMKLLIDGRVAKGIQIGAVGTIPEYRAQGLSRMLMEYFLDKYCDAADIFFLFANDTVLDYYPRFGFSQYHEVDFISESAIPKPDFAARRLNIGLKSDAAIVHDLLQNRLPITRLFGALEYDFITWWHILNIYPENLYYVEDDEILFIVSEDARRLYIRDIIYTRPFDLSSALPKVIRRQETEAIVYNFSPDQLHFAYDRTDVCSESPLFIRGRFSLTGSEQFRFPMTAQT